MNLVLSRQESKCIVGCDYHGNKQISSYSSAKQWVGNASFTTGNFLSWNGECQKELNKSLRHEIITSNNVSGCKMDVTF